MRFRVTARKPDDGGGYLVYIGVLAGLDALRHGRTIPRPQNESFSQTDPLPGGHTLVQRTDGFTVDSFSAGLPGQLADMRVFNDRLIVATRAPVLTIHAIDSAGGVTALYEGTVPQSGTIMGLAGGGLVFCDREPSGLSRLMLTDGVTPGAHIVADVPLPGEPRDCMVHDGAIYFMGQGVAGFDEAWRTDGTYPGTLRLSTWDVEGPVLGKAVVHEGVVYYMTTWASRHSLWRVGPEYPGALRVYHSEPQPFYAAPEFVAGGRLYLRDTQGRLWRGEPTPTSFQLAGFSFAGEPNASLQRALAVLGDMAVITDQQNRLWTVDFREPPEEVDDSGCAAGAGMTASPVALAALVMGWRRRRRIA